MFVAGNVLHRPHRQPVTLTDAELRVLLACDGRATIGDVLDSTGVADAGVVLARLAELGAVRLDLEGPADAWPERLLRDKLELIADPGARAAALAPLEQLVTARDAVAAAAGDPAGLQAGAGSPGRDVRAGHRVGVDPQGGSELRGPDPGVYRCGPGRAGGAGPGRDPGAGRSARPGAGQRPLGGQRHRRPVPRPVHRPARPRDHPDAAARPSRCSGCSPSHRPTCTATAAGGRASSPGRASPSCSGGGRWCSGRRRRLAGTRSAPMRSAPGPPSASPAARSPGAAPGSTRRTS